MNVLRESLMGQGWPWGAKVEAIATIDDALANKSRRAMAETRDTVQCVAAGRTAREIFPRLRGDLSFSGARPGVASPQPDKVSAWINIPESSDITICSDF